MTAKKRKPLDDALAHEFVYGKDEKVAEIQAEPEPEPLLLTQSEPPIAQEFKKSSLMSQLQQPSREPTIRLTVDLPESMHRKLSVLAAKTSRKKVEIVRLLLDEALKDIEE